MIKKIFKSLDYIPTEQLKKNYVYYGEGNNFNFAIWTGLIFIGINHRYDCKFTDAEFPIDKNGSFKPLKELASIEWNNNSIENILNEIKENFLKKEE